MQAEVLPSRASDADYFLTEPLDAGHRERLVGHRMIELPWRTGPRVILRPICQWCMKQIGKCDCGSCKAEKCY